MTETVQVQHGLNSRGWHVYTLPTVTELHDRITEDLVFNSKFGLDWSAGSETGLVNVVGVAESMDWNYDLRRMWVNWTRWRTMVRQYLDPVELDAWAGLVRQTTKRGIAVYRTNTVKSSGTGRSQRRRWGSCMLSFSYRHVPKPTLTMHSRTCYMGYLSVLDLSVAENMAWIAAEEMGIDVKEIEFVWNLEMAQFHGFRSLAWVLMDKNTDEQFQSLRAGGNTRAMPPGVAKAHSGLARIERSDANGVLYGDESFASFARARRRYHTEYHGYDYGEAFEGGTRYGPKARFKPLPELWTPSLDLEPLYGKVIPPVPINDRSS